MHEVVPERSPPGRPDDLLSSPDAGPTAIRGGTLRISSFAAGSVFGIVGGALLFRHLGVVDAGRYTLALSLGALVTGLTDLGLTAIGMRELATLEGERRARMATSLLGIRIVLTSIGVLAVTVFAFLAYGTLLAIGVLIAGAGVLLTSVQTTLAVPLMAGLRLGWVSALDLARVIVTTALIVLFVVLDARLLPFLATSVVGAAIVLIPTAILARGNIPLRPSFQFAQWRELLKPILAYSLAVAAATLYFRLALVIVSLLAGDQELGYFSLSFRIVEILFVLPGLLVGAAFPIFARAARDDPARLGYALSRVFEVSLIVGAWIALSLAAGAPLAIAIIGGPSFESAAPILAIHGLALGATFVNAVWGFAMLSLHMHRTILLLSVASLAALAVTVTGLVMLDGARGGAIGTAAVEVGVTVLSAALLVRGRPHLRPRLAIVPKVALAALLGAAPMLATGVPVAGRVVLCGVVYAAVLFATRAFPDELDALLPAARRRPR